jgi:hypothetical protein
MPIKPVWMHEVMVGDVGEELVDLKRTGSG